MQNVTQLSVSKRHRVRDDERTYPFIGAIAGFSFYWLAFVVPFLVYGSNATLFFMLYTWPFFLALMPASVLIGVFFSMACKGNTALVILCSGAVIICLFWLVFSFITGW